MKRFAVVCLLALCVLPAWSWDFCQKNKDGVMLYYNFYDDDFQMCEVAYCKGAEYTCFELDIPDVVVLPNKYEGWEDTLLAVVSIENFAFRRGQFSYVHLPETVGNIGDYAFYDTPLCKVEFGKEWCFRIGKGAFMGCTELDSVTIPSCVMELGVGAFSGCRSLSHLVIEDNENLTELPAECFGGAEIRNFTLPGFIKKIGDGCFTAAKIKMNNGLEIIGNSALNGTLEEFEIPETVKELGDKVFKTEQSLTQASCATPKRLYINCKTPPYCRAVTTLGPQYYDFDEKKYTWTIPQQYKIIVPLGTKDIYQTTWPWSRYDERCYIQRNTSGIETVEVDDSQDEESIFTLDGRQIDFKQKGVNIVRHKDGTARKVLVK